MTRLSAATLGTLPPTFETPRYDRAQVKTGVVHLGIGAFHRAHQAVVFDDAIRRGDPRWGGSAHRARAWAAESRACAGGAGDSQRLTIST